MRPIGHIVLSERIPRLKGEVHHMSWQLIRTMSPEHFAQAIRVLGLKPAQAARYLGMSDRQMRRLIRGERSIPEADVLLLGCMIAHRLRPVVPKRSTR